MLRSYFGLAKNPFSIDDIALMSHQQSVHDILQVHSQQGGFCLLLGEPGAGKTVIKETIKRTADKRTVVVTVARTLHTYTNTIKILCLAFNIEYKYTHFKCEKALIEEAFSLHQEGKKIIIIIDDAHLMEIDTLRKIRLLLEDFPNNYNLILVGQPGLLNTLALKVHADIKSRITYSVTLKRLNPDDMQAFILAQLDRVGLGHNTFTEDALALIVRSADGLMRMARNLCIGCMLEAVRNQTRTIDLPEVNAVLMQPHWHTPHEVDNSTTILAK